MARRCGGGGGGGGVAAGKRSQVQWRDAGARPHSVSGRCAAEKLTRRANLISPPDPLPVYPEYPKREQRHLAGRWDG